MRRPLTAQDRIAARYIPAGYTLLKEEYNGIVYVSPSGLTGIAFRGTAMHSEWHTTYQNKTRFDLSVSAWFRGLAETAEWKASRKATRDKGETDTQKVKKALKAAGYNVTSVHRGSGTAYNWIDITIDDYDQYIDQDGNTQRRYGDVMRIAKIAAGREHLHDDISTDLFMVNINVHFTKYHRCSECIISNCQEWHEPESCARGCFYSKEMAAADQIKRERWQQEEQKKKGIVAAPVPNNQIDLINTVVNCGAIITIPASQYTELKEQGKTDEQIFDIAGCEPVKSAVPAGYIPYLGLSIVEEMI